MRVGRVHKFLSAWREREIDPVLNKLTFAHIFLIWAGVILIFGFIYGLLATDTAYLVELRSYTRVVSLSDAIYFSFITATTTGFGDIIPVGAFKLIAVFEVVCGLLLLALVTSKLVSIKQDVILSETYEMSFKDRINRLRSSLYLFRQNITRFIEKLEDGPLKKREIADLYLHIAPLQDTLMEIRALITRSGKNMYVQVIDGLSAELLMDSTLSSLERLHELLSNFGKARVDWRNKKLTKSIEHNLDLADSIVNRLIKFDLSDQTVETMIRRNEEIQSELKKRLNPKKKRRAKKTKKKK